MGEDGGFLVDIVTDAFDVSGNGAGEFIAIQWMCSLRCPDNCSIVARRVASAPNKGLDRIRPRALEP